MKPINMDKILKAFAKCVEASNDYGMKKRDEKYWGPANVHEAFVRYESAKADYEGLLAPLGDAIKAAEGRATERLLNAETVVEMLVSIENYLGISKAAMDGISVWCDYHAQKFPNAYKYVPMSTQFRAEYKNRHWTVTEIGRYSVNSPSREVLVNHTEESKAALIERFKTFTI